MVDSHFESSEGTDESLSTLRIEDFKDGLKILSKGEIDFLAVPAAILKGNESEIASNNCSVVGARTPRRPNMVLVSPDKIPYQPKSAIIVSDSELIRRQLRRARPDLNAIAFEEVSNESEDISEYSNIEKFKHLSELLEEGAIDGFVASRNQYDDSKLSERRHTLMPFPKERGGAYFLPRPFSDLVAIIAREGFPNSLESMITEPEGNTILWIQSRLMASLGDEISEKIGIQVRHRQVGSLLRQAELDKDLALREACSDSEGEISEDEVRVEVKMETLSEDGRRTLSLERMVAFSDYKHAIISLMKDWDSLIKEATREVPKDHPSDIHAPPFINHGR